MNHSKTVREINKRLPCLKWRDVMEVLEIQDMQVSGAILQQLQRRHGPELDI